MSKIPVCHLFKLYISKSKVLWAEKQQIVETIFSCTQYKKTAVCLCHYIFSNQNIQVFLQ